MNQVLVNPAFGCHMNGLTRRKLLGCVGVGGIVAAGGCTDTLLDSEPDEARLAIVEVRNLWGEAAIEAEVVVEEDTGETVFSETWEIEPGNHWGNTSVATERGQYIVGVTVGDLHEAVDIVDAADGDDVCLHIEFQTGTDDEGVPDQLTSNIRPPFDDC